jgi:hypothetical protein
MTIKPINAVAMKLYRGTTILECNDLLAGIQGRPITHWCESYEKAKMYSKGAVVCLVLDEVPPQLKNYRSVCQGDAVHGTFTEYKIPHSFFSNVLHNWAEDDSHVIVG